MTSAKERTWLMLVLVGAGCLGCAETRFLSCQARDPRVESRSYDLHDPFPDETVGPETFSRPRTFQEPRSENRKSFDLRNLLAVRDTGVPIHAEWDPAAAGVVAGVPLHPVWRPQPAGVPLATRPGLWDDTAPRYNNVVPY